MTIIVYSAREDAAERRLLQNTGLAGTRPCRSVQELKGRLNLFGQQRKIVILLIADAEEMGRVSGLIELYTDLFLIVVLGTDLPSVRKAAYRLRPRYVTYQDGPFRDISDVLARMMERYGRSHLLSRTKPEKPLEV